MSTPRFVQIVGLEGHHRVAALDAEGNVWLFAPWRPEGEQGDYRSCWHKLTDTMEDAWPKPKPKLEECLISPPTPEEEAEREVNQILQRLEGT